MDGHVPKSEVHQLAGLATRLQLSNKGAALMVHGIRKSRLQAAGKTTQTKAEVLQSRRPNPQQYHGGDRATPCADGERRTGNPPVDSAQHDL